MIQLQNRMGISNQEWRHVRSSFLFFFFLMCSYFILRPVRDEMGIQAGVANMQWLFTGTFLAMLLVIPIFGLLMKRIQRHKLLPRIYLFFAANIFLFYLLFALTPSWLLSAAFFIWLSVFNLFVISIFWSFNADIFDSSQAKRLYGPIAAGGSTGAICGPIISTFCGGWLGIPNLLLISALFLIVATLFLNNLIRHMKRAKEVTLQPAPLSSIWQGLLLAWHSPFLRQISLFILLYTSVSTFLYFEQAHIISEAYSSSADRTFYFGTRDLLVNIFTLLFQFLVTKRLLKGFGIPTALMIVPAIGVIGFLLLGIFPTVTVLLVIQIVYRSLNFSIQRPTREILFTRLTIHEKYNSKNFIDTFIYRGGDALSGWLFAGLNAIISSLQFISLLTIPLAGIWMIVGRRIGKQFNQTQTDHYAHETIIEKKSA